MHNQLGGAVVTLLCFGLVVFFTWPIKSKPAEPAELEQLLDDEIFITRLSQQYKAEPEVAPQVLPEVTEPPGNAPDVTPVPEVAPNSPVAPRRRFLFRRN